MRHAAPPCRRRRVVSNREIFVIAPAVRRVPRPTPKIVHWRGSTWTNTVAVREWWGRGRCGPRMWLGSGLQRVMRKRVPDTLFLSCGWPVRRRGPLRGGRARGKGRWVVWLPAVRTNVRRCVAASQASRRQLYIGQGMRTWRWRRRLGSD